MDKRVRWIVGGGIVALAATLIIVKLLFTHEDDMVDAKGVIYYNGPMKAKGENRYGTADGKTFTQSEADKIAKDFQAKLDSSR